MATYNLRDFKLQSGVTLPDAKLSYETHGELNEARDNVIVFGTWAAGRHADVALLIGGLWPVLDPAKYFIVVPDMFCNGLSTSPSNTPPPLDGPRFPVVTPYDNIIAQHRLLTEHFDVQRIQLVVGFSMSAQQAFHWGALYPDLVERICSVCGSAKTSPHNWAYLSGLKAIIASAEGWNGGECEAWPPALQQALVRIMLMMALSQDVLRKGDHLTIGGADYESTEELFNVWSGGFLSDWRPIDFYKQIDTWMAADVSAHDRFRGSLDAALAAIQSRAIVMPCKTDQYFRVEDNEFEVSKMPNAELRVIPSIWGHLAGGSLGDRVGASFINDALRGLLDSPSA